MAASRALLSQKRGYDDTYDSFSWQIPQKFNIATAICDHWCTHDPDRPAIIDVATDGTSVDHSFRDLDGASNRMANALVQMGITRGDVVGILLPQRVETAIVHLAALKIGAISLPLFVLFGPDALSHRLTDAGAKVVITDADGHRTLENLLEELPQMQVVSVEDTSDAGYAARLNRASAEFIPCDTASDDPAILIYTSGTTGPPKGALHGHRVLLGHLAGFEFGLNFAPKEGDVIWTPADWAWIGGLLDVLLPALYHGIPVVAHRFGKFTSDGAIALMRVHKVRLAFLPPTALKLMQKDLPTLDPPLNLRAIISGGEALGPDLIAWGEAIFNCTINEIYGQTECNLSLMSCSVLGPVTPGYLGRPVPGFEVAILDSNTGTFLDVGAVGTIAVKAPNPVMFLRYLNRPDATEAKFVETDAERWLLTGDLGRKCKNGLFQFVGRDDDIISSAGYRIGPSEVEACVQKHPSVNLAGVVGMPDPIRGSVVAAYVTLAHGFEPSETLADDIAAHVKTQLAAYEYPRVVRFLQAMPLTATGKIIRADLRALAEAEVRDELRAPRTK